MRVTCGARSTGFYQECLAASNEIPFVALCGNNGELLEGHRQQRNTIPHALSAKLDGHAMGETDLRRFTLKPVMGPGGLHSRAGAASGEPHVPDNTVIT